MCKEKNRGRNAKPKDTQRLKKEGIIGFEMRQRVVVRTSE